MNKPKIISLVKICAFAVFIGRAYQLYFFGGPYRAILWDESLLTPIVEDVFNYTWFEYATSSPVNSWIEGFTKLNSIIFLMAAICSLLWNQIKWQPIKRFFVGLGLWLLLLLAICMVKDRNYDFLQLFEMSIQLTAPFLLWKGVNMNPKNKNLIFSLKVSIALTFIPHGLLAMAIPYRPGHFIDMTIILLGVNETQASQFLFMIGFLDVFMAIMAFVPKLSRYALGYMIFWGFITAFARLISGFNSDFIASTLHGSTYLTVYRLAHGILPLIVLLLEMKRVKQPLKIKMA
ncbi:hypothetical protein [Winogradskyella bathintestinalis]|uniref:Exosortase/archaeosortase family protein n=1 Tax=Winogradskyella bathintestinalis TaxID=3035208 RepID=A0ABT7ZX64_9FLAO|nr:hypothetical protein [Winogradskyella bathintestinalis]MDN3493594.1 hypothetical protein [Winogradskyella bathintestinalis]